MVSYPATKVCSEAREGKMRKNLSNERRNVDTSTSFNEKIGYHRDGQDHEKRGGDPASKRKKKG